LEGEVNTHKLRFIVDTGATLVSLPRTFANSVSLSCDDKVVMDTANGMSDGCTTKIKELKVGDFLLKDVIALIIDKLNQPLLGMNALRSFNYEQKNGEMRLSEPELK
jgi:aspartyl protease family protein